MKILNLTQHKATPDQEKAGVHNLEGDKLEKLKELLTFDEFSRDAKEYFAWLDTRLNHVPQTGYFYSEPYSF